MSIVVCTEQRGLFQTSRLLLRESFDQIVCLDFSRLSEVRDKPKVTALICGLDSFVDSKILELFPNLKFVVSPTTGVTHLDQHELEKYVRVITLQTEKEFLNTITSTAEIAWFHLLNAGRHGANEIAALASSGNWNRYRFESCQISSRIVGIIGYGRLGKRLSEYCRAFQISRTMFFDPFVDQNNKESEVIKANTLKDLIDRCDTLFVTATLSDDTQGLISRELLERCRQNTIIVNVSRGELVDHVALIDVLVERKDVIYCADVVEYEEDTNSKKFRVLLEQLIKLPNIYLTPHIGGSALDAMEKTQVHIIQKLNRLLGH